MFTFLSQSSPETWAVLFPRNNAPFKHNITYHKEVGSNKLSMHLRNLFISGLYEEPQQKSAQAQQPPPNTGKVYGHCHDFRRGFAALLLYFGVSCTLLLVLLGPTLDGIQDMHWQSKLYYIAFALALPFLGYSFLRALYRMWVLYLVRRVYGDVYLHLSCSPVPRAKDTAFEVVFDKALDRPRFTSISYRLTCLQSKVSFVRAAASYDYKEVYQQPWKNLHDHKSINIPAQSPPSDLTSVEHFKDADGRVSTEIGEPTYWEIEIFISAQTPYYNRFLISVV